MATQAAKPFTRKRKSLDNPGSVLRAKEQVRTIEVKQRKKDDAAIVAAAKRKEARLAADSRYNVPLHVRATLTATCAETSAWPSPLPTSMYAM